MLQDMVQKGARFSGGELIKAMKTHPEIIPDLISLGANIHQSLMWLNKNRLYKEYSEKLVSLGADIHSALLLAMEGNHANAVSNLLKFSLEHKNRIAIDLALALVRFYIDRVSGTANDYFSCKGLFGYTKSQKLMALHALYDAFQDMDDIQVETRLNHHLKVLGSQFKLLRDLYENIRQSHSLCSSIALRGNTA